MKQFPRILGLSFVIGLSLGLLISAKTGYAAQTASCVKNGQWLTLDDKTATAQPATSATLMAQMSKRSVVLLGEVHTSAEHHRWQLQTLAALHAHNPNIVLGFEAFPKETQPVLDQWVRGELDEATFLRKSEWHKVWSYDADFYLPLFHFARMHRLPMIALNEDRERIARVGKTGWGAISPVIRKNLSPPVPPSDAYRNRLADVYATHNKKDGDTDTAKTDHKQKHTTPQTLYQDPAFQRFVDVQLAWDRVMAGALTNARANGDTPLVVGIVGQGHMQYGDGIPHQLRDLGITDSAVLLPWDATTPCNHLHNADGTPIAEAVFGLPQLQHSAPAKKVLLGVMITTKDKQVVVEKVVDDSVAQNAGIQPGDIIVKAAGHLVTTNAQLVEVIQSTQPGTWLPLAVMRDNQPIEIIAKFPAETPSVHKKK